MKTMKNPLHLLKSFWLLLFLLLLLSANVLAASGPVSQVNDGAGLLSKQEVTDLTARLQELEKKYNVHLMVYTSKGSQVKNAGQTANQLVDQIKPGAAGGTMVLVLDMQSRDWYISTDNTMRQKITDEAGIKYISNDMVPKLSDGKYAAAFNVFADKADELLAYYDKEGKPYDPSDEFSILALLLTIVGGAIVYYLIREWMMGKMTNVATATEADAYLNQDSFDLTRNRDTFLYTTESRSIKKKEESSSTSSRDSDHGGGGGKF